MSEHPVYETEALIGVRNWVRGELEANPAALAFYRSEHNDREALEELRWQDFAAIRILDYIDNAGREFEDLNLRGQIAVNNPIKTIWLAVTHGTGGAKPFFFEDMLQLFRQLSGRSECRPPTREKIQEWLG